MCVWERERGGERERDRKSGVEVLFYSIIRLSSTLLTEFGTGYPKLAMGELEPRRF